MDIDQNKHRSETRSCFNCNEKRTHLETLPETSEATDFSWLNQLNSTSKTCGEAVVAVMDAREIGKKAEEPKEGF